MEVSKLKRVMLVEDEPDIQTIARLVLETVGGFDVEICSSGREALEKAVSFTPDLILLDVMMPGMSGPTTLEKLREQEASVKTPVIFMTAKVQPQEINEYRTSSVLGVISKPFDPMTLCDTIRQIWKEAQE